MTAQKKKENKRALRRSARVHYRVRTVSDRLRVAVFRSNKHIYAQLIDDSKHTTIAAASTLTLTDASGDKSVQAKMVGKQLAAKALEAGLDKVCFDRGRYLYHGRVEALAEGLREGGLVL